MYEKIRKADKKTAFIPFRTLILPRKRFNTYICICLPHPSDKEEHLETIHIFSFSFISRFNKFLSFTLCTFICFKYQQIIKLLIYDSTFLFNKPIRNLTFTTFDYWYWVEICPSWFTWLCETLISTFATDGLIPPSACFRLFFCYNLDI